MSRAEVICSQCGSVARLLSVEGALFPARTSEKPILFQVIDCPKCGQREQPDGHNGTSSPIPPPN
jgi:hypothetical protein